MERVETGLKHHILKNHIIVALLFVLSLWFIVQLREILVILFMGYILMVALLPYVEFLVKHKIPRALAAGIVYFVVLAVVALLIVPLIPFFSTQFQSLIRSFPAYLNGILKLLRVEMNPSQIQAFIVSQLNAIGSSAFAVTGAILGTVFSTFLVFVISFYLTLDYERMKRELSLLFPKNQKEKMMDILMQVEDKLGAWFRGQIVLCFSIGLLTWIALSIINFPFALPLALLAGLLEIIPTIGPILSAVPAAIVALSISPGMTFLVILIYIGIQALENNLFVPKIMQRAVGLNPILIIIGISVGATLMGIIGALLSIPFIAMLIIIIRNISEE
ncbi:MAG: AI-2E family transporter [Candidatus Levyibacteriota bacterium]